MPQSSYSIKALLNCCKFLNRSFNVFELPCAEEQSHNGYLIQIQYEDKDVDTGKVELQKGRKWYISAHAVDSEIVRTAFLACLQSMEHIARENFEFDGVRIFGPHFDVDALVKIAQRDDVYERREPPPPSMDELSARDVMMLSLLQTSITADEATRIVKTISDDAVPLASKILKNKNIVSERPCPGFSGSCPYAFTIKSPTANLCERCLEDYRSGSI